jgi:hypothetical protein
MNHNERQVASARLLVSRLERLSADSYWAHQASGLRGSLLRCLQQFDLPAETKEFDYEAPVRDRQHLEELVKRGFEILGRAAQAMHRPTPRTRKW